MAGGKWRAAEDSGNCWIVSGAEGRWTLHNWVVNWWTVGVDYVAYWLRCAAARSHSSLFNRGIQCTALGIMGIWLKKRCVDADEAFATRSWVWDMTHSRAATAALDGIFKRVSPHLNCFTPGYRKDTFSHGIYINTIEDQCNRDMTWFWFTQHHPQNCLKVIMAGALEPGACSWTGSTQTKTASDVRMGFYL